MTIREKHIARRRRARRGAFAAFVAGVAALCCVACINEYPDAAPQVQGPSLALMVSLMDIEDDPKDAANELERMHNLRVIITHKEGEKEVIEYNRFIDFNDTEGKYKYGYLEDLRLIFLVRQEWIGKSRNVYLFANSEPIFERMFTETDGLSGHLDPEEGAYGGNHRKDFEQELTDKYLAAIKDVTFTNEELQEFVKPEKGGTPNGIPMSAEYRDVEFEPGNTGIANISVFNSYIVRAANKITFTYINDRLLGDIAVKNWELFNTAEKSWLLPHVPADKGTNPSLFGTETKYKGNWIAWYADHIGSGGHEAELNFDTPEGVVMSPFSANYTAEATVEKGETTEKVTGLRVRQRNIRTESDAPAVNDSITYYFLESRYIPEGADAQRYTMKFNTLEYKETPITEGDSKYYWQDTYYPTGSLELYLDKVTTLLRNTHVKITATFADKGQLDMDVSIINWIENSPVTGTLVPE